MAGPTYRPEDRIAKRPDLSVTVTGDRVRVYSPTREDVSVSHFRTPSKLVSGTFTVESSIISPYTSAAAAASLPFLWSSVVVLTALGDFSTLTARRPPGFLAVDSVWWCLHVGTLCTGLSRCLLFLAIRTFSLLGFPELTL